MSSTEDDSPDADTILERIAQKLQGDDETDDEQTDSAGQKGDADDSPDADAEQKQPDADEEDVTEDLIAALAEDLDVDPAELREVVANLGQDADDEDMDDDDDEEEDEEDVGQDAEESGSTEVNIDFGAKLEEHSVLTEDDLDGVLTEEDLGEKMDEFRETVVEDLGQKLADANEEAIEELGQKMASGQTPSPAGGTFQDAEDFEAQLEKAAEGEGW